jgi:hypothetical protein
MEGSASTPPMRIRVLESMRGEFRNKLVMEAPSVTARSLHDDCLNAVRDHPSVVKREDWEKHFPAGVGTNLVDTTRYWLSGDNYTLAGLLWNHGLHSSLGGKTKQYFQLVNAVQNDALKMIAREMGTW